MKYYRVDPAAGYDVDIMNTSIIFYHGPNYKVYPGELLTPGEYRKISKHINPSFLNLFDEVYIKKTEVFKDLGGDRFTTHIVNANNIPEHECYYFRSGDRLLNYRLRAFMDALKLKYMIYNQTTVFIREDPAGVNLINKWLDNYYNKYGMTF